MGEVRKGSNIRESCYLPTLGTQESKVGEVRV